MPRNSFINGYINKTAEKNVKKTRKRENNTVKCKSGTVRPTALN
jgi:hypothetical protein